MKGVANRLQRELGGRGAGQHRRIEERKTIIVSICMTHFVRLINSTFGSIISNAGMWIQVENLVFKITNHIKEIKIVDLYRG